MTQQTPQTTPAFNPWDVPSLYAASFISFGGLFAPGALMAARLRAAEDNRFCQPSPRA